MRPIDDPDYALSSQNPGSVLYPGEKHFSGQMVNHKSR
jgi:hypothetical protein